MDRIRAWLHRYGVTLFLLGVCILALCLRVHLRYAGDGYIYYGIPSTGNPKSDAISLNIHALNLVAGRGFGDYVHGFRMVSFVPPGHPFLLGLYYFCLGNKPLLLGWAVALMGSLVPVFLYLFTREMWGRKAGCIAALLAAVYPPYVRIGFSLMSEPSAIFITAIALWLCVKLLRECSVRTALLAGLTFSVATLVRPAGLAFVFALSPWLLWAPSFPWRRRLLVFICFVVALGSLHIGWMVRNRMVHDKPGMPYSSVGVRHAWTGANPKYGPWFYSRGSWHETLWTKPHSSEIDRMFRLRAEADEFVRRDRVGHFFGSFWRLRLLFDADLRRLRHPDGIRWAFDTMSSVASLALWLLAMIGLVVGARSRTVTEWRDQHHEAPGWVWSVAFSSSLAMAMAGAAIYGASDRYRWPLEYVLFPFAAMGILALTGIAHTGLIARRELRVRLEQPNRWQRIFIRVVLGALCLLMHWYSASLIHTYLNPPNAVAATHVNTRDAVMAKMAACGLTQEFDGQSPQWISYEDVFEERARNYGAVTTLKDLIVVWHGRLVYPTYRPEGNLHESYFVVNPSDSDFGGARLPLHWRGTSENGLPDLKDGDIVTIIAHIRYTEAPMLGPVLETKGIMRGRFPLP